MCFAASAVVSSSALHIFVPGIMRHRPSVMVNSALGFISWQLVIWFSLYVEFFVGFLMGFGLIQLVLARSLLIAFVADFSFRTFFFVTRRATVISALLGWFFKLFRLASHCFVRVFFDAARGAMHRFAFMVQVLCFIPHVLLLDRHFSCSRHCLTAHSSRGSWTGVLWSELFSLRGGRRPCTRCLSD